MTYTATKFHFDFAQDFAADLFVAALAEIGFESFENIDNGIMAYIPTRVLDKAQVEQLVAEFPYPTVRLEEYISIEDQNWNEEWEKHFFQPIVIDDKCVIHSSFHKDIPAVPYDIVIDPKMAFGTGHHQTTSLMISALLQADLQGKSLLDMGCGTAVLAIAARMRGASPVTAIDIDDWCTDNARENIAANKVDNIEVLLGDAALLAGRQFNVIMANINRNILLTDMPHYAACLPEQGHLYMSGFYTEDVTLLDEKAHDLHLHLVEVKEKEHWAMAHFVKY